MCADALRDLERLQAAFSAAVFGSAPDEWLLSRIVCSGDLDPLQRLNVYRGSVVGGMTGALADIYPVCKTIVGAEFFDAMAMHFVDQTPSKSPDLNDYGKGFAAFCEHFEPAKTLAYLPDVARLEWAAHCAQWAAAPPRFDVAALSALDEDALERVVFSAPPGSALVASPFPIVKIWEMGSQDTADVETLDLDAGGERVLIWRHVEAVRMELLSPDMWRFLNATMTTMSFGQVAAAMAACDPTPDIESLLPHAIEAGWISHFRVPSATSP